MQSTSDPTMELEKEILIIKTINMPTIRFYASRMPI